MTLVISCRDHYPLLEMSSACKCFPYLVNSYQVNRNPISDEIQRMSQHIEYLQAELACSRGVGTESDEVQVTFSFC